MKNYYYKPVEMKITERKSLCENVVAYRLAIPKSTVFTFTPGQFVMLSVLGFGEIPIGITSSPLEKGYIEVAVRSVGMVSQKICSLEVGEKIGVNGPFGNGFPLSKLRGKDVYLVAGGIGLFPLRSLINHYGLNRKIAKSMTVLTGARSPKFLAYRDEYPNWCKYIRLYLTVDECDPSWNECIGNIGKLFDIVEVSPGAVMIAVGPPIMYKAVIERYAAKRVADTDLYFDLERRMKCGIGKCQHCTCGRKYVCLDGPVFSYAEIKYNPEAF